MTMPTDAATTCTTLLLQHSLCSFFRWLTATCVRVRTHVCTQCMIQSNGQTCEVDYEVCWRCRGIHHTTYMHCVRLPEICTT
jgi:hypothetical protein